MRNGFLNLDFGKENKIKIKMINHFKKKYLKNIGSEIKINTESQNQHILEPSITK